MPERNVDVTHLFNMRKVVKLLWTNLFLGQHLKGQMSYRSRDTAPFLNTDLLMFNFSTFSGLIGAGINNVFCICQIAEKIYLQIPLFSLYNMWTKQFLFHFIYLLSDSKSVVSNIVPSVHNVNTTTTVG